MASEKSYLKGHKASGLKVGDKVKIVRKAKDFEKGWSTVWIGSMDGTVNTMGTITSDDREYGFMIDKNAYYPYFVLEKVVSKKAAKSTKPTTKKKVTKKVIKK